jgi:hypothetical protein
MIRKLRRRKYRYGNEHFVPDPHCADRHRHGFKPSGRHASKAASQVRWQSKDGNGDYPGGPRAVAQVQAWCKAHPGYWRRMTNTSEGTQTIDQKRVNPDQSFCNVPR